MLRLRPIMMTALVACFGLLPAAMSTGIGSDSQKPFAIVIVGGLMPRLVCQRFLRRLEPRVGLAVAGVRCGLRHSSGKMRSPMSGRAS